MNTITFQPQTPEEEVEWQSAKPLIERAEALVKSIDDLQAKIDGQDSGLQQEEGQVERETERQDAALDRDIDAEVEEVDDAALEVIRDTE